MTWARTQPKRGDLVLHCGHLCPEYECGQICGRGFHWYDQEHGPIIFTRGKDGPPVEAHWVVVCQLCCMKRGTRPIEELPLPGERRWNSNRRVITCLETRSAR